jgi:adenosylcobyric acid synthase
MVLGCTSSAGKSLMVTALARWFRRQGVDVVPYKAQNMSNNARVVDGGEIGVAQWLQSLAAGQTPSVAMNPVLIKPEGDTRSQVVVQGQVRHDLADVPWTQRGESLWPAMSSSFDQLRSRHELVLLEGAGSPAEINLPDQVNNRVLAHADAAALLVVDIDRGGAFAHLVGTWSLVPETTRQRLSAYVLNKFRGDPSLLEPGPTRLREMTGLRLGGVVPMMDHDLPDEEGATLRVSGHALGPRVGVVRYPFASNLDEFHMLARCARVEWITDPRGVVDCDLVILPGSKHVAADMTWLRARGLDAALGERTSRGATTWGICGGAMMLGTRIADPLGVEGAAEGLGLLPLVTDFEPTKITAPATVRFGDMPAPFGALSGLIALGYEIRHGRISADDCVVAPLVWSRGPVLATTVHGLFEDLSVLEAVVGRRPDTSLDDTFDRLADVVEELLDTDLLRELVGLDARRPARSRP